jgi:Alcohol dehydrogenase GroES-like domain
MTPARVECRCNDSQSRHDELTEKASAATIRILLSQLACVSSVEQFKIGQFDLPLRSAGSRFLEFGDSISLDALRLVERPDPTPGPHEIVVRIRAAGLNFRDLAMMRGSYHINVSPPLIPFSDGAGEVMALGSRVTRFEKGDLVCPTYLPDWQDLVFQRGRVQPKLRAFIDTVKVVLGARRRLASKSSVSVGN